MSFDALMKTTYRLAASLDALSALGAELRLRREGGSIPAEVQIRLKDVMRVVDPLALSDLSPEDEATALAIIESLFRQAVDLLHNASRAPGWFYTDPKIINGQGMTSRTFVRVFETVGAEVSDFKATLDRPGIFLDVGTGAALLAIEVARRWPTWKVVAIDRWKPALELAQENIDRNGCSEAIELKHCDLMQLDVEKKYSLAWLPGPFLPKNSVLMSLERVKKSLVPGGWVVFSLFSPPNDSFGEAIAALRVTRNGGHPWQREELEQTFRNLGLRQVSTHATVGSTVTIGQRSPD